jgi:hypothetical protein
MSTQDLQINIKKSFFALTLITQACHGIVNTRLKAPKPKPKWFDDLSELLITAQVKALFWIKKLGPGITDEILGQVIDFGKTFDTALSQIMNIATTHPDSSGKDNQYIKKVHDLISSLETSVNDAIANAKNKFRMLEEWGTEMNNSQGELIDAINFIQNKEYTLDNEISEMRSAIRTLIVEATDKTKLITAPSGAPYDGVSSIIVGILLAPATGGGSLTNAYVVGLTNSAIKRKSETADSGESKITEEKELLNLQDRINYLFDNIAKDQKKLGSEKRLVVALSGVTCSCGQVVRYIDSSTRALLELNARWNFYLEELSEIKKALLQGTDSLESIVSATISVSKTEWDAATALAAKIIDMKIIITTKNLPMSSKSD